MLNDDDESAGTGAPKHTHAHTRPGYSPELAEAVLKRIRAGELLSVICLEDDMPTRDAFYGWLGSRPELKERYLLARLCWADHWAERALAMSLDSSKDIFYDSDGSAKIDHAAVQRCRLQIDTIKWMASKYAPKVYGDRPAVEAENTGPITIRWQSDPKPSTPAPEPPRQLEYKPAKLPGDLSERDWTMLLSILDRVKARTPSGSEKPPSEVLQAIERAIDQLYAEPSPAKKVTLPRRGRK
jgi:hypothetical protein